MEPATPTRRTLLATAGAIGIPALLTAIFIPLRDHTPNRFTFVVAYFLAVMFIATGGPIPALIAAITAGLLTDYYFFTPLGSIDFGPSNVSFLVASLVASAFVIALHRKQHTPTADTEEGLTAAEAINQSFARCCGAHQWSAVYVDPADTQYVQVLHHPGQTLEETAQLLADGVHALRCTGCPHCCALLPNSA